MPRIAPSISGPSDKTGYRGKQAKTGNSLGFRFDRALFRAHPEFSGEVRAHVIAPGRMLVIAEQPKSPRNERDPVLESFLSFLSADMAKHPEQIKPLDPRLARKIDKLVGHIAADADEDLGNERLL